MTTSKEMFELYNTSAQTYGTMLLGAWINQAQGVNAVRQFEACSAMETNIKNLIKTAINMRDNETI